MLTSTMDFGEVVAEVMADMRSLETWSAINLKSAEKEALRKKLLPTTVEKRWVSPQGNTWTVLWIMDPRLSRHTLQLEWTMLDDEDGCYVFRPMTTDDGWQVSVFSPHFWRRYRERFLKDDKLKQSQVVRKFMRRNLNGQHQANQDDRSRFACFTTDGILLGNYLKGNGCYYRTFITRNMAREDQLWNFGVGDLEFHKIPLTRGLSYRESIEATRRAEQVAEEQLAKVRNDDYEQRLYRRRRETERRDKVPAKLKKNSK